MARHSWGLVTVDLRRSVEERRRLLHRCVHCGVYRSPQKVEDRRLTGGRDRWRTHYGHPYEPGWVRACPECPGPQGTTFDPNHLTLTAKGSMGG